MNRTAHQSNAAAIANLRAQIAVLEAAAGPAGFSDESNPHHALQLLSVDLLSQAARGLLDLNAAAALELADRGLDVSGQWVGFKAASVALELLRA